MMRKFIKNLNLHAKLVIFFSVITFLVMIVPSLFLYHHYNKIYRRNTLKTMEYAVAGNVERMQTLLDTIEAAIDCVNDNRSSYKTPDSMKLSAIVDMIVSYEDGDDDQNLREMALEKKNNEQFFKSLFITALNSVGENEISSTLIVLDEYPIAKHMSLWKKGGESAFCRAEGVDRWDWYQETLKKDGNVYWFNDEEYPERLFMSKLLKYQYMDQNGEYEVRDLGVILVDFSLSWMAERINMSELTEGSMVLIADEKGTVFFDNLEMKEITEEEVAYLLNHIEDGVTSDYKHERENFLVQKNVLRQGLNVFTFIPDYEIREITAGMVKTNLILAAVVFLLCILVLAVMSKYLWNPIQKLADHMKQGRVEKMEENQDRTDEIGILYRGYNQLQNRIQELIFEVWESAEEKRKIELKMLQAQINPHFLYNTLGAISCNALLNGQSEIAQQITALTAIVRYNIKDQDALVPLKTELEMISHYEEIWNMSYEEKLEFYHNICKDCENILIPKLIIQPLVENAILHGIKLHKEKGKVYIEAELDEAGNLLIKVANNGVKADVERLNAYVQGNCKLDADKDSIGVKNVWERILRYFGEDGMLFYRINQYGNTEAVISIGMQYLKDT